MKTPIKNIGRKITLKIKAAPASALVRKSHRPTGPGKTFHKDGHWIENPRKAPVLTCVCGNRYLKTRDRQGKCLRCISQGR